jgi:hypothetical protein
MLGRSGPGARVEWIAPAWGGLLPGLVLIATIPQPFEIRLALFALAAVAGGFLAGVRAPMRRPLHGALAALFAMALYAAFVLLTRLAHRVGASADPVAFSPSSPSQLALLALAGLAAGILGGWIAAGRLTSAGASRLGG